MSFVRREETRSDLTRQRRHPHPQTHRHPHRRTHHMSPPRQHTRASLTPSRPLPSLQEMQRDYTTRGRAASEADAQRLDQFRQVIDKHDKLVEALKRDLSQAIPE